MKKKLDGLIKKWDIDREYMRKSMQILLGREMPDEFVYGEIHPNKVLSLLPECLVDYFLKSDFRLTYSNSAKTSSYFPKRNEAIFKSTHDLLHELGHSLWYNLIPGDELHKKAAIIASVSEEDRTYREVVEECSIPTMHKEYARLIGAYSGQFLAKDYPDNRMNDLEEHFARNFDYLIKGKPLVALPNSTAFIDDFLAFYRRYGIIDAKFERFYRTLIKMMDNSQGLQKILIRDMEDGDKINTNLIRTIEKLKNKAVIQKTP